MTTPLTPETLGQVVRRSRGAVTGVSAAKDAGVSGSFWSDVEKDRRTPSRLVLARMCGAVVGNWNEWLVAWARERLDGAFDDLLATLDRERRERVDPDPGSGWTHVPYRTSSGQPSEFDGECATCPEPFPCAAERLRLAGERVDPDRIRREVIEAVEEADRDRTEEEGGIDAEAIGNIVHAILSSERRERVDPDLRAALAEAHWALVNWVNRTDEAYLSLLDRIEPLVTPEDAANADAIADRALLVATEAATRDASPEPLDIAAVADALRATYATALNASDYSNWQPDAEFFAAEYARLADPTTPRPR